MANHPCLRIKRVSFTLLEMLVVLCVLAMGLSLTGIKIKQVYEEQHFLTEVQQIVSHLQMAQDLMLIMDANVEVSFGQDSETRSLYYQLKAYGSLISRAAVNEEKQFLKKVRRIELDGQVVRESHDIVIKFYSKGLAMTSGKLILSLQDQRDGQQGYQICLAGYPRFIESQKYQVMARPARIEEQPELFPKELLELLDVNKKNQEQTPL